MVWRKTEKSGREIIKCKKTQEYEKVRERKHLLR